MYKRYIKRILDILLSSVGIIITALPMLIIAAVIKADSPGPAFFRQKRVGIRKTYFDIVKFRTMPVTVSPDVPTHLMNRDIELTKVQRFLRRSSIDELPQLFCIWIGKMSIVGPRPALWNQEDLVAERDKYGANDVKPGLTGWAQINGRDELEIPIKAKLDGDYAAVLKKGGMKAFAMDCRCTFGSVSPVLRHEGVIDSTSNKNRAQQ